jgi:parvulin-like peptidyl-prolyl isomerase
VRRDAVVEIEASQIVVTWEGAVRSRATRSREEARARIEEARAALAAGTPFAEAARTWSDGVEAERGGDLGRIAPGQMIPAFEEAAFALRPGEVSDVVETPYGFHLVLRRS